MNHVYQVMGVFIVSLTLSQVSIILGCLSFIVSIGFTCYKWVKEIRKK